MKKLLLAILLACPFGWLAADHVVGTYEMSYFNDVHPQSYNVIVTDVDSLGCFDFLVQVRGEDGKGENAIDTYIVIDGEDAMDFVCLVEKMRDDYVRYSDFVKTGEAHEDYVRFFEHSFDSITFTWLYDGRMWSGGIDEITPMFVTLSDKDMYFSLVCTLNAIDDSRVYANICLVFSNKDEFDRLIFAINAGNVIEEVERSK